MEPLRFPFCSCFVTFGINFCFYPHSSYRVLYTTALYFIANGVSLTSIFFLELIGFICKYMNANRCWKKQLIIARDARRVDVLCYRIYMSYRLLDGTLRFKEMHEIIKNAKVKLEAEVGPLNGISAKMARGIVSRLSVAGDVQALCSLAIEKADKWLAITSNVNPNYGGSD